MYRVYFPIITKTLTFHRISRVLQLELKTTNLSSAKEGNSWAIVFNYLNSSPQWEIISFVLSNRKK